ncbi:MAG: bifunctional adenosylcobinamide kinase/adenosylcobinamide-phosphate guanylyltransferase [Fibrobacteria bacterium]|nr:bifunctional adenosylcobinamide kinase/adenosylcobinamide-phosphate guanylyltransferase [Fibrobacteria bacterium]
MAEIILITGGSRSGKSRYAQKLAESLSGKRAFIATCPKVDEEMDARIKRHQADRSPELWTTIEEPVNLNKVFRTMGIYEVFLLDCITLWVNNLMYEGNKIGKKYSEDNITEKCREWIATVKNLDCTLIVVTNEVGMSVIPADPETRLYRDLIGRANQVIAEAADKVALVACGQTLYLKGCGEQQ